MTLATVKATAADGNLQIRKARRLPFAPFDVYGRTRLHPSFHHLAGGFFTLRAAKVWVAANEHIYNQEAFTDNW